MLKMNEKLLFFYFFDTVYMIKIKFRLNIFKNLQ